MDVGLLEAVFDAPIGTLLAVAGIVLLLVAAGLRWKFEPGTYGRLFAGAMGIVLVAVGTVLVVTDESPDKVAALPTATASPSVTATATDTATGRATATGSATATGTTTATATLSRRGRREVDIPLGRPVGRSDRAPSRR